MNRKGSRRILALLAGLIPAAVLATALLAADPPVAPALDDQTFINLRSITQALERAGRVEESIGLLGPYAQDPRVLELLEELYRKSGHPEEFLPLVEERFRAQPEELRLLALFLRTLDRAGLEDSLLRVGRSHLAAAPTDPNRFLFLGNLYRSLGKPGPALELLREGQTRTGTQVQFNRPLAEALIDLGRPVEALEEILGYLSGPAATDLPLAQRQLYRILEGGEKAGELVRGRLERELKAARERNRQELLILLVDLNLTLGAPERALGSLRELLGELPPESGLQQLTVFIGRSLKLGQPAAALEAYALAESLKLMPPAAILLGRADVELQLPDPARAESTLKTIAAAGEYPAEVRVQALERLGALYLERLDRPDGALEAYRRIEGLGTEGRDLFAIKLKIVRSFIRLDQLDQAGALCGELVAAAGVRVQPEQAQVLRLLGDVLLFGGEVDSAADIYRTFARMRLGEPEANEAIERAYLIQNDTSPERVAGKLVGRALHLAERGELQLSAAAFQQALEQAADSSYRAQVVFQLGRVYEEAREYPLALGVYQELVRTYPRHHLAPLAELRQGIVLLEGIGDRERAREHLERVVVEYPAGVATPLARRLLRALDEDRL